MKKYTLKLKKVEIHFSTFLFFFIAVISGRFQTFFFLFLFAFIHEFFHYIGALLFKLRADNISIYPFGFSIRTEPLINIEWYKELIIVVLGPLSYFFSLFLINNFELLGMLSRVGAQNAKETNLFILCFNLLPIIPLDGSRIIKIILGFFITEKNCMKINGLISLITLIFYIIILPVQLTIYLFLIYSQSEYWFNFKYNYLLFVIGRGKVFDFYKIKVHEKKDFYRNYDNIFINGQNILTEQEYIDKIFWKGEITL